jgi:8-oxo-dGTP pyrophosphatase MutT (NUDIX family)
MSLAAASGPAADPQAPYVRLAVVGLICREGGGAGRGAGAGDSPVGAGSAGGAGDGRSGVVDARWLLLHRAQPFEAWDPPGGRVEAAEDLVQAMRREVMEETGLAVYVWGPCYAFLTFYKGERVLAVSMACRPSSDPDTIRLEPDGAVGWRWATTEEWQQLAAAGLSSWDPADVKKAARTVAALQEAERE